MTEPTEQFDPIAAAEEANKNLGALAERMGIKFLEFTPERSVATMPVEGNTQPMGLLHGGAHLVLAETMGSFSAHYFARLRGYQYYAVGIEISATHTKAATEGVVTATSEAIHLGGTLVTHQVKVEDAQGRRLSTVRITNMIREFPKK